ncbi:CDC27 family protein [Nonomuraea sp. NPDC050663]|uniref:CDC27 family protein n=1 Tax=Nonomuraea sp. NPDC050663 TaxID=3364370 RepID=UPI0037902521
MDPNGATTAPAGPAEPPDPARVRTPDQLAQALKALAGSRGPTAIETAAGNLRPPESLTKQTVSDMLRTGRTSERTLAAFLRVCGVPRDRHEAWQTALRRARAEGREPDLARLVNLMRAADAKTRDLGVHPAIDVPGAAGDQPVYVERDIDTDPAGLRGLIRDAVESGQGRLLLLVGKSSVGKSRCACAAVQDLLSHWWLLVPTDVEQIRQAATAPPSELVVWLDELQNYLMGTAGLTADLVRSLTGRGVLLIATMRDDFYRPYSRQPGPGDSRSYAAEWEVVKKQAATITIPAALSPDERTRAAASGDKRLKAGLQITGYELFPAIAAAPALTTHAKTADPYARAVLEAAVDAGRLGARSALTSDLLRRAAPGYCDERQRAVAASNWFESAMAYLTLQLQGAAAVLDPIAPPGTMGGPHGYMVADFPQQTIGQQRRSRRVPTSTWHALIEHLTNAEDRVRVAAAATDRLLYSCAEELLLAPTPITQGEAAQWLAHLLAEQGRVEDLRVLADTGNVYAGLELANQGRIEEAVDVLRTLADTGNDHAGQELSKLLVRQGRIEDLRALVDTGNSPAARELAGQLAKRGSLEEAITVLRAPTDAGDSAAALQLAKLLADRGSIEEAITVLQASTDTGDAHLSKQLAHLLADLLIDQDRIAEAITALPAPPDPDSYGDDRVALKLTGLLVEQGRIEDLRALANTGYDHADRKLSQLLAAQGRIEDLHDMAEAGSDHAAQKMASLLAKQGRIEDLHDMAEAGSDHAAQKMASLLAKQGRIEDLHDMADAGSDHAAFYLALLARGQGIESLRALADTGNDYAAHLLAGHLAERGRAEEAIAVLQAAGTSNTSCARRLAELLAKQGRVEEAIAVLTYNGSFSAAGELAELLADQGYHEEAIAVMRVPAETTDSFAALRLADLLSQRRRIEDLRALAHTGNIHAAARLAELLATQGRVEDLRALVLVGTPYAAEWLIWLLGEQGTVEEADRLRRYGLPLETDDT